jgi:hypothetical protein
MSCVPHNKPLQTTPRSNTGLDWELSALHATTCLALHAKEEKEGGDKVIKTVTRRIRGL